LTKGQIEGGTLQALGYGMMEEVVMKNGKMTNDRLTNYMLPTCMDAPEMEVILIEKPYPQAHSASKASASCRWMALRPRPRSLRRFAMRWILRLPSCRLRRSGCWMLLRRS